MSKIRFIIIVLLAVCLQTTANTQELSYFLPQGNYTLNPDIPTPKQFLGFNPGEHHVSHDQVLFYMRELAKKSSRIIAKEIGVTYENRPLIFLIISSEANLGKIDEIQKNQLLLTDPSKSSSLNLNDMPVVMWFGYSVHGNEASGVNASLAVAYYLAAAEGNEIEQILKESVIIIQPAQNPDGIQKFANWVNSARSHSGVTDQFSREFREPAPSSRSNHYWFDLNRDWLLGQQPETFNRMKLFMDWHPVLVNDYHEQGSTSNPYFSPGLKGSVNEIVPSGNRKLTEEIALYHADAITSDGSLFFTKEVYDNFYPGKGASYPDLLGAIGILYEMPSSRGHHQIVNGVTVKFPDIVRYQAMCSYSAIKAGIEKRIELNKYKMDAYKEASNMASKGLTKGYIINGEGDKSLMKELLHILSVHRIDLFTLSKDVIINGKKFDALSSYILPLDQKEYRIIRTLFDKLTHYVDTTFYDITAWTLPLAMNLNYQPLTTTVGLIGSKVERINGNNYSQPEFSNVGYLFEIKDLGSYNLLYSLQNHGMKIKVSDMPFTVEKGGNKYSFDYGTIFIPVVEQGISPDVVHQKLIELNQQGCIQIFAVHTSMGIEFDLGSSHFQRITMPNIAIIIGRGASYSPIGELWHLLDLKYKIPASIIDASMLPELDLSRYNTIVLNGNYRFPKDVNDKLKSWSQMTGNRFIAIDQAFATLNEIGITDIKEKQDQRVVSPQLNYIDNRYNRGNTSISGVILKADIDRGNPLLYGVKSDNIYLFKRGRTTISETSAQFTTPVNYSKDPLVSGYLSASNLERVKGMPAVFTGRGAVYFCDNPYFRAYWFGTSRLFMNAIFFRELMPNAMIQTR
ncbi:MAG TPA: hypothetical protein DF637_01670 [Rikenellaceae bacterium]|nr:hypothetical protein [Rikenellaceae bacterium]